MLTKCQDGDVLVYVQILALPRLLEGYHIYDSCMRAAYDTCYWCCTPHNTAWKSGGPLHTEPFSTSFWFWTDTATAVLGGVDQGFAMFFLPRVIQSPDTCAERQLVRAYNLFLTIGELLKSTFNGQIMLRCRHRYRHPHRSSFMDRLKNAYATLSSKVGHATSFCMLLYQDKLLLA